MSQLPSSKDSGFLQEELYKISVLIDYAKKNNIIPILTFQQNPKNLDFLNKDNLC